MPKVWIDAGHGGNDVGAVGFGRYEKTDNLAYALELGRQFEAQGFTPVYTRTTDKAVTLAVRTALERKEGCALAIACHRNGADTDSASGLEIWLHSKAPDRYVAWARDIVDGIRVLGLPIRAGQAINGRQEPGIYRGFRTDRNANYYANDNTNAPSMLIEMGFISAASDNAWFDANYKAACTVIVKASCRFLGMEYRETSREDAELRQRIDELEGEVKELRQTMARIHELTA